MPEYNTHQLGQSEAQSTHLLCINCYRLRFFSIYQRKTMHHLMRELLEIAFDGPCSVNPNCQRRWQHIYVPGRREMLVP